MYKRVLDFLKFLFYILGNILQLFIIVVFVNFMCHQFEEWMVNLYVATNCSYRGFYEMFRLLLDSAVIVLGICVLRYGWFKFKFLKNGHHHSRKRGRS